MVSPYHTTGFYHAPVTKGLMGGLVMSSAAFLFPLGAHRHRLMCSQDDIIDKQNIGKLLLSKLVFLDPKDMFFACVLLYHFRIFERRYGSRKFASYLLFNFIASLLLEIGALWSCYWMDLKLDALTTGLFAMVFSLFVPYFCDVPRVAITHVVGIPVTGKSLTYIIGLQMASSSLECALSMACGVLSGLLSKSLQIGNYPLIPRCVANFMQSTVGRLLDTPPPQDFTKHVGATLDLQRQEQIESLEQQMVMRNIQQQPQRGMGFGLFGNHNIRDEPAPVEPPSEEQIQQLADMGFQRENILRALQATNNNVGMATNLLLHDS